MQDKSIGMKKYIKYVVYIMMLVPSYFLASELMLAFDYLGIFNTGISHNIAFGCITVVISFVITSVFFVVLKAINILRKNMKRYLGSFYYLFCLGLIVFILVPVQYILLNSADYSFSLWTLLLSNGMVFFLSLVVIMVMCALLDEKEIAKFNSLLVSLIVAFSMQHFFLNTSLGPLDGRKYAFLDHPVNSCVSLIAFIIAFVVFAVKTKGKLLITEKARMIICGYAIFIISVVVIIGVFSADKSVYSEKVFGYLPDEQYTVSNDKNVILFIFDAFDNSYAKTLYDEEQYVFDELNDFTMYTNTCSVYAHTRNSIPQMLAGTTYDGGGADYYEFYERLGKDGYRVNFYGYESEAKLNLAQFADNYVKIDALSDNYERRVDYWSIVQHSLRLSMYDLFPNVLKTYAEPETIDFTKQYQIIGAMENVINYENDDYMKGLTLVKSDDSDKRFIVEHLDGTHIPIERDTYEEEAKICLDILVEYIRQLKDLGVYDDATIIVTSDHGTHFASNEEYNIAPTPVFLIKEPNSKHETMVLNDAPIYHTDILATILYNANLLDAEDGDRFGSTIYSYGPDDERLRFWCERGTTSDFIVYQYSGTTSDLEKVIVQDEYFEYWE